VDYIELKIVRPADTEAEEILIARLAGIGFESFVEEKRYLLAYIPGDEFSEEKYAEIKEIVRADDDAIRYALIEDQNWNAVWESNYNPVMIAGKCFVRAPFHDPDPSAEFDIILRPKMAFGTAHHETTALMAEVLLDAHVEGKRVLDMGCGTAVLAIIASKMGAGKIVAIDNDEWAYTNAVENAALNDVSDIDIMLGDAEILGNSCFDLILANINKNILLSDMAAYAEVLNNAGLIFFSGFYEEDLDDIKTAANQKGLIFVKYYVNNNWVVAIFKKQ
jgi:ribosomal protein L11 methyltransferase